jgi:ABC-2 type transport system ATP-binding protein
MRISTDSVVKQYDGVRAVDGISCDFEGSGIIGLLGPNGAGKTTLIRMMMDIIRPDSGAITYDGRSISAEIKGRIGYLPEERGLYRQQKVGEQLEYLARLKGLSSQDAKARAGKYLDRWEMTSYAAKPLAELSKGNQQKIQIIASILHEPEFLLFDEPFSGLDPINARMVKDLFLELRDKGHTVVLSTHQMEMVEEMCHRVYLLNRGKMVLEGKVAEIRRRYADNAVWLNDDTPLNDIPAVQSVVKKGARQKVYLAPDATPAGFLEMLIQKGRMPDYFETAITPMEDVFIRAVKGDGEGA